MSKKVIRLTENDVERLVKRILKEDFSKAQKLGAIAVGAGISAASIFLAAAINDVKVTDKNGVEREAKTGEVFKGVIDKIKPVTWTRQDNDIILYVKTDKNETVEARVSTNLDLTLIVPDLSKGFKDFKNQTFRVGDTITFKVDPKSYFFDRKVNLKK